MTTALTIGQVAAQAGVSNDTIRLYERYGLIAPPKRGNNGYRQYSQESISQLLFIKRTKHMGFTLKEIQALLKLHHTSQKSCGKVKDRAQEKLQQVITKIDELKQLERALNELIRNCEHHLPQALCPLFIALQGREDHR